MKTKKNTAANGLTSRCKSVLAVLAVILVAVATILSCDPPGKTPPKPTPKNTAVRLYYQSSADIKDEIAPNGIAHYSDAFNVGDPAKTLQFNLLNSGNVPVQLNGNGGLAVTISGRNAADFRITQAPMSLTLRPGDMCSILITFSPTAFGNHLAQFDINTDLAAGPFTFFISTDVVVPTTRITNNGLDGQWNAIAVDNQNKVHIVYYNGVMNYTTNKSGSWVFQQIDSGSIVGQYCDIALDSNGFAHVVYYDMSYKETIGGVIKFGGLKYATNKSGAWVKTIIHLTGDAMVFGADFHIAIGSNNAVYVAFWNQDAFAIQTGTNAGGSWQFTTFSDPAATPQRFFGFTLDANDKTHLFYLCDTYDVKYATNKTGTFQYATIDNVGKNGYDWGWFPAVATDSAGNVHLAYRNLGDLMYATNKTGVWQMIKTGGLSPFYISLALDSSGFAYISYNQVGDDLYCTTNRSGEWISNLIEKGVCNEMKGDLQCSSIAVDSLNKAHIAYYDTASLNLGLHYFSF
jgi:hypothetical protein